MRADRLVAILLLLQTRGRVTAAEVADELEISERTARRDLDALGMAGLPVYSTQGRGGGWFLAGGGRTDLTGLTATEARALFLVAGPSSEASPELRAALRKLVRALPESFRTGAEATTTSVLVDSQGWDRRGAGEGRPAPATDFLDAVQEAVTEGRELDLGYVARDGATTTRVVQPLGLAAKGVIWYLVADTAKGLRTFRVDRITSARSTGNPVTRPADFDLAEAWQLITDEVEEKRAPLRAVGWADPEMVPVLRWVLGTRLRIGPARADGWVEVEVRGHHTQSLAGEIAGFGAALDLRGPPEVLERLAQIGTELRARYG